MAAGDDIVRFLECRTVFGYALSFATQAAFQARGWDLTFKDIDGAELSPQPTWTIEADDTSGIHRVAFVEPESFWYAAITVPGGDYCPQLLLSGLGEAYSNDDLAALILSAVGTATVAGGAALTGRLDDWVEGDILYRTPLEIPQLALDAVGATGLDDAGLTILAGIKRPFPTTESAAAEISALTVSVVSVGSRTVKLDNAWVAALAVGTGNERVAYKIDISLKKTTRRITSNRYDIDVVWQADTQA